jgi:cell division protein FtsB
MSAAGSYHPTNVADDRRAPQPLDTPGTAPSTRSRSVVARHDAPETPSAVDTASLDPADDATALDPAEAAASQGLATDGVDLSSLSIAGITRRRVGWIAASLLSAWIIVVFARQAAEASTAANRADEIARENVALVAEIDALEGELEVIERPAYVAQQARGYRLGSPKEIPFTLDPSVASPGPNAPGSASVRIGAQEERATPLESWLSLLFGPTD